MSLRRGLRIVIPDDALFPVQACLNAPSDDMFLEVFCSLADGVGFGYDASGCIPAGDPDGEGPVSGVLFYLHGEPDVTLSAIETLKHLKAAFDQHARLRPHEKAAAEMLYGRIEARLLDGGAAA